jgi:(2R)-3-sulfolactate dehydrogenase (NADP+)
MGDVTLSLEEAKGLAARILMRHGTREDNAAQVAAALVAAETDGQAGHGLSRLPSYAAQSASGKVDGFATPSVAYPSPTVARIDAAKGFAYPAITAAVSAIETLAIEFGVGIAVIHNSHHCGVAGHHVERLADLGLVALMFANTPKAIAPWGGNQPLLGTNPIAFAAPRVDAPSLVIDLSLSKVARGKIMMAARQGHPIPAGWATDRTGAVTTDPHEALSGSLMPTGDAKGAALALMVEILAAALTGSHFGFEASSFFEGEGEAPAVGQLLLGFAPGPLSGDRFSERLETLADAITDQPGARLPGSGRDDLRQRARQVGLTISDTLFDELSLLAGD